MHVIAHIYLCLLHIYIFIYLYYSIKYKLNGLFNSARL